MWAVNFQHFGNKQMPTVVCIAYIYESFLSERLFFRDDKRRRYCASLSFIGTRALLADLVSHKHNVI